VLDIGVDVAFSGVNDGQVGYPLRVPVTSTKGRLTKARRCSVAKLETGDMEGQRGAPPTPVNTMRRLSDYIHTALGPISFRGKVRLLALVTPREGLLTARIFGQELHLDLSNFLDRMIYMGCYEPLNTYRFKRVLQRGMVVVDVGANIGYFTLLAASLVGEEGQVFAIEPWPANFAVLQQSIARNALRHVRAFPFGLGATEGLGHVSQADQRVFNNRTATMAGDEGTGTPVAVRTLDHCISEWHLDRIDLLKIDVDGYETQILEGASNALRSGVVRNIIIELNEFWLQRTNSSSAAVRATLRSAGFRDLAGEQRIAAFLLGPVEDAHFQLSSRQHQRLAQLLQRPP
jgi:FkbM family methyltransferase